MIRSLVRPTAKTLLLLIAALPLYACSLKSIALKQTVGILKESLPAFEQEWDYELVERSLPANIKTVEGFLVSAPNDQDLLLMLARAYGAYAMVLIEDRMEQAKARADASDAIETPEVDRHRLRAREMYSRAHRYALRALEERRPGFSAAFAKGRDALKRALKTCDKDDVPALFWVGMPLASAVNIGRDDVTMIAKLPHLEALMTRVVALDEGYYYAGAHLVLGGLYGGVGKMLGGDPVKAKKHFERALILTKRRFLLVQTMYARTLAVQLQDKKLFRSLLEEVLTATSAILPEQRLANVAAKRKAARTLARQGELF
ncbi:MAG: hypothetical protein CSA65_07220 [Proteobacteria bacterium]|nr:MAG: hypothetical protein CSB49_00695 [Pseudomonadota bacterium]PIE17938.1 MAG: hypothetical protein CSA65_07220 [Pseudomonadota bacterium]